MPNTQRRAGFAETRTYLYHGRPVDHQTHLGLDLASTEHAPVPAANAGRVVFAGWLVIYGNAVIVDHGYGLMSLYGHMSAISVKPGDVVAKGQQLGNSGSTGLAGGDHLHLEIFVQGKSVDPLEWLDEHWIRDNIAQQDQAALEAWSVVRGPWSVVRVPRRPPAAPCGVDSGMSEQSLQDRYAPSTRCFGCGPANPDGLRIKSFVRGDEVVCEWAPAKRHEAFDGALNGGIVGTLFDCHCNWTAAHHLMTASGADSTAVHGDRRVQGGAQAADALDRVGHGAGEGRRDRRRPGGGRGRAGERRRDDRDVPRRLRRGPGGSPGVSPVVNRRRRDEGARPHPAVVL